MLEPLGPWVCRGWTGEVGSQLLDSFAPEVRERKKEGQGEKRRREEGKRGKIKRGNQQKLEAELEEGGMAEDGNCLFLVRPGSLSGRD